MSADDDEGEPFKGFEDGTNRFFPAKPVRSDAPRKARQYASTKNKKSGDVEPSNEDIFCKTFSEDQEINKNSRSESMQNHCANVHHAKTKRNKVIWTTDLHKKFLEAIEEIGRDRAVPKTILEVMKVEGLTRDNIASHLQKHRICMKKLADANCQIQVASEPSLLDGSITNKSTSEQRNLQTYSGMDAINPPILDTSSFCFPILESSSLNSTTPLELVHSHSLSNQGYFKQVTTTPTQGTHKSIDSQSNLIYDATKLGAWNSGSLNSLDSTNYGFKQNIDHFINNCGGLYPSNNTEMGSSWNDVNLTNTENSSNSSFLQNSNGFNDNCASQSIFVEMGSSNGSNSNKEPLTNWNDEIKVNTDVISNLQNEITEDNLIVDDVDIASLWEILHPKETYTDHQGGYVGTSTNQLLSPDPQKQFSSAAMSTYDDEGETFKGFENGADQLFPAKPGRSDAPRKARQYASTKNKKSGDVEFSNEGIFCKTFDEDQEINKNSRSESIQSRSPDVHHAKKKKNKVIWTTDLHKKFLEAIEKIGLDRAVPKTILEVMKVEGLTRNNIASHLQKHRICMKKLPNATCQIQAASEQRNLQTYSGMDAINPPIVDTSSFSFPILESSSFNSTTPSEIAHSHSLSNQGYFKQVSTTPTQGTHRSIDSQSNLIYNATELGAWNSGSLNSINSTNSGFIQNLDGFINNYGSLYPSNNTEMGSSWNDVNLTNTRNSSNSSFLHSSDNYCVSQDVFVETGSSSGANSNKKPLTIGNDEVKVNTDLISNQQNEITEDDLILDDADIASLWEILNPEVTYTVHQGEYGGTSANQLLSPDPQNQVANNVENFPNIGSFEDHFSTQQHSNEEAMANNKNYNLDGYFSGVDPTFNMHDDEQLLEFMWRNEPVEEDLTIQGLF